MAVVLLASLLCGCGEGSPDGGTAAPAAEAAAPETEQETATVPPETVTAPESLETEAAVESSETETAAQPETEAAVGSSETGAAARPETSSGETQDEADGSDETEAESGVSASEEPDTEEEVMQEGYFSNEQFKDLKIADPFVLKASDGMYYLYGTTGGKGFSCRKSEDLLDWGLSRTCFMPTSKDWCGSGSTFWAPEVVELDGKYYMFYTSRNSEGSLRIGVAFCDTPDGFFQNLKNEPLFDPGYAVIDPNVLIDDDGVKYLYYSRDCSENIVDGKKTSQIYGVQLEDDFSGIAGEPVMLLTPEQPWELASGGQLWNEAPEMIKHDGKYYLSYSANLYSTSAYSVGYAVSDSPLGPFVKAEENPILTSVGKYGKSREDVSGTGHHSFTVSPDGTELWAAYHSHIDPSDPKKGRRFNLDRAGFTEDGKLYIDGPTTEPQPVPSGSSDTPAGATQEPAGSESAAKAAAEPAQAAQPETGGESSQPENGLADGSRFTVDGDLSEWDGLAAMQFAGWNDAAKGATFYGVMADDGLYLACDAYHGIYTAFSNPSGWNRNSTYFRVNLVNNAVGVYATGLDSQGQTFADPSSTCKITRAVMKTTETGGDGPVKYHTVTEVFIAAEDLPAYYVFPNTASVSLAWRTPGDKVTGTDAWEIKGDNVDPALCPMVATPTGLYWAKNYGEYKLIQKGKKDASDPGSWEPVEYAANMPETGVTLHDGLIKELFDRNIEYILRCYRESGYCEDSPNWSQWLPAFNDSRMLAGAANSLIWNEDSQVNGQLRGIVDEIIVRIKSQAREDGYFNYYPEEEAYTCIDVPEEPGSIFHVNTHNSERKNADRVFWVRGMIAAADSGNEDALPILRAMCDWYNASEQYLPYMLRGLNSTNAFPAGPLMYHTELGKSEDITIHQRYLDLDFWMDQFIRREPEAFSYFPGRPHTYDLLELEALADEYRATGEQRYLDALLGAWDIYHDGYLHTGGVTAICESGGPYPYKSYYITTGHNGETCGSVFWIWINGRLMQLYPSEEKYVSEIEQSLFNVVAASRNAEGKTRYHNRLQGTKEAATSKGSCCEVSSTMLISELPKYIYMEDEKGLWVNLFVPSEIKTDKLSLEMETGFPDGCDVSLHVKEADGNARICIRIPSWAAGDTEIFVNGESAGTGTPGTYVELEREWKSGDTITFTHQMGLTAVEYEGRDAAPNGHDRYALMYGPILMAVTGNLGSDDIPEIRCSAGKLPSKLVPEESRKLHFTVEGQTDLHYVPYYEIDKERFCCFPTVSGKD